MFTHLHCHSYYSFGSGTIRTSELPLLAKQHGMTAVALTDTNNMTGVIEFYVTCKKVGIKPIIGVELLNKDERVVLLAKNTDGYREICETVAKVLEAIPKIKPKITFVNIMQEKMDEPPRQMQSHHSLLSFVEHLSDNVIIISSTAKILQRLSLIRQQDLYLELIPSERQNWRILRELFKTRKIPLLATNNVVMGSKSDYTTHKVLRAIGLNTNIGLLRKNDFADQSQCFASEHEMRTILSGVGEEAFANANKIVNECNVEFDFEKPKFAKFPCENPERLLRSLAEKGLWKKYMEPSVEHIQRFAYELEMINKLGATNYFLATSDMIEYAKKRNFPYLGRGSGANSFIAYLLGISNVDPIENNLRFERFLNPERISLPDFDCDFSWKDRYEVINYMLDKYGRENSAMLCTIQTYKSRGSIRQIGKALGFGDAEITSVYSRLSAMRYSEDSIDPTILNNKQLNDVTEWLTLAHSITGFPSHLSLHSGGVIFADKAIANYAPTQMMPIGVPALQIDMFSAEEVGLVKLDILATRGLGTFMDTLLLVEKRTGKRPAVATDVNVALNDARTKEIIRTGKTKGVFYVESPAMISLLKKLECDTFQMLTAASSVIRPGVASSGMMKEFIERHHDHARIDYLHPKMEELLSETYGIMIYQEDVLNVVHEIAGLSYGQADLFRRAMSGKMRSNESMQSMKDTFMQGCIKNKVTVHIADELWRQISSFAGYSFCKAHSASYAVLSFQETWLKCYYPTEFLCSVLNNYGGYYSHQEYINEAKLLDIEVLLPCVNRSPLEHTVEQDHCIRLGLTAVREVNDKSKQSIVHNRDEFGRYMSIEDFAMRSGVTPEDGRILIAIGACDVFGKQREEMQIIFSALTHAHSHGFGITKRKAAKIKNSQTVMELDNTTTSYDLDHLSESSPYFDFCLEQKHFGYSVTNHPSNFLPNNPNAVSSTSLELYTNKRITVQGYVSARKDVRTKKGDPMVILNVSDKCGTVDVVVWSNVFTKYYSVLASSQALLITGRVQDSFGAYSLIADTIERVEFTSQS